VVSDSFFFDLDAAELGYGGGIFIYKSAQWSLVIGCTFVRCYAEHGGGAVTSDSKILDVTRCCARDCWSNGDVNYGRPAVFGFGSGSSQSTTSMLEIHDCRRSSGTGGTGMIAVDSNGNGRLRVESVNFTDCKTSQAAFAHTYSTDSPIEVIYIYVGFEAVVEEEFVHTKAQAPLLIQISSIIR
jgi:hypothetical protein